DRTGVYVGRRGTGKTATMIAARGTLRDDRRNLVCSITPAGYQMEGLARLLRAYPEPDTRGYVIEAIWKFLLYSEVALAAVDDIRRRPAGLQPEAPEWALSEYLDGEGSNLRADFDIRLERAIRALEETPEATSLEEERASIVEALYRQPLGGIHRLLGEAL